MNTVLGFLASAFIGVFAWLAVGIGASPMVVLAIALLMGLPFMFMSGYENPTDWQLAPLIVTFFATIFAVFVLAEMQVRDGDLSRINHVLFSPYMLDLYAVVVACWAMAYGSHKYRLYRNQARVRRAEPKAIRDMPYHAR